MVVGLLTAMMHLPNTSKRAATSGCQNIAVQKRWPWVSTPTPLFWYSSTYLSNKSVFPLHDVLHPSHRCVSEPSSLNKNGFSYCHPPCSWLFSFVPEILFLISLSYLLYKMYLPDTTIGSPFCISPNTTGISDPVKRQKLFILSSVHKLPSF